MNNNNLLWIGLLGIGAYFLLKKSSSGTTEIDDTYNAKLTYLQEWTGGQGNLSAIVIGAAAEGPNSVNQLYNLAVKDANNQPWTTAETAFYTSLISKYA